MSFKTTFYVIKNRRFDMPYYIFNTKDIQLECSICLEKMEKDNDIVALDICDHIYHEKCIREWLSKSRICPLCRSNVDDNDCRCIIF